MKVNNIILAVNPFFDAYVHSDFLGKLIFIGLILLSLCSWIVLTHKFFFNFQARKNSLHFKQIFLSQKSNPLSVECADLPSSNRPNPFLELYLVLKKQTIEILNKNRCFGVAHAQEATCHEGKEVVSSYLSPTDINIVESHLCSMIAVQTKQLEKNVYMLSTIVSLAPFLGLLGTVWGILTTFSELQTHTGGGTHQMVLGGLSLALATTVLGLLDAIPALIGYNYLKNTISDFETEMEGFSTEILTSIEMQYRKVDIQ